MKCTGLPISTFEDKQIFAGDTAVVVSALFAIQLFTSPLFESDLTLYSLGFLANFPKKILSFQMTRLLVVPKTINWLYTDQNIRDHEMNTKPSLYNTI